jgi:ubiquinone/menaquinone biosynthesis C-methylase UbiE
VTDTRDLVKKQFGANAEHYVTSRVHAKGESLDRLVALAEPRPEWRVLDIATGGGHTALALAPLVREVVATDLTPRMLAVARDFLVSKGASNAVFQEADATQLPFPDGAFDLVTCRIAPHHFPDVPRFVAETHRVLRSGGRAIVIDNVVPEDAEAADFINRFEKRRDPSHNRCLPPSEWVDLFTRTGFQDIHVEHFFKAIEFEAWSDIKSVDEATRGELREMLVDAPPQALDTLFPEDRNDALWFYLQELLIAGRRA